MFSSPNVETASGVISFPNYKMTTMKTLVKFLYSSQINPEDVNEELFKASDEFLLEELKTVCAKIFASTINLANVLDVLILGNRHNSAVLTDAAEAFVIANLKVVRASAQWNELTKTDPELVIQLLCNFAITFQENVSQKEST